MAQVSYRQAYSEAYCVVRWRRMPSQPDAGQSNTATRVRLAEAEALVQNRHDFIE